MHSVPTVVSRLLSGTTESERDEAWRMFLIDYSRLLMHVARSMVSDHDGSMDAYTHVLGALRADDHARLRTFVADGRSKFSTWLVVVARRLCVDFLRSQYGRERPGESETVRAERLLRRRLIDLTSEDVELGAIRDVAETIDDRVVARELHEQLARALAALSPSDRLLIKLRYEDDLPAAEIGQIVKLPSAFHVYRRLEIIVASLRRALIGRGAESSVG